DPVTRRDERPPAVAGAFYPEDPTELTELLRAADGDPRGPPASPARPEGTSTRALGVPHAGYRYSGAIAARAYRWLDGQAAPSEILVLGVDHHGSGALF